MNDDLNDFVYRSSPIADVREEKRSTKDEHDISSLTIVEEWLREQMQNLDSDFHSFPALEDKDPEVAAKMLLVEIQARKRAYEIMRPVWDKIRTAIKAVNG